MAILRIICAKGDYCFLVHLTFRTIIMCLCPMTFANCSSPAFLITNVEKSSSISRMGDKVVDYCKAEYLSRKYNIPFLLNYSSDFDIFALSLQKKRLNEAMRKNYGVHIIVKTENDIRENLKTQCNVLFFINAYTKLDLNDLPNTGITYDSRNIEQIFALMQVDNNFKEEIKTRLSLQNFKCCQTVKRQGELSVAVQIRRGNGLDKEIFLGESICLSEQFFGSCRKIIFADLVHPTKFPPTQYYVDQINRLAELFPKKILRIYCVTDEDDPVGLIEILKKNICHDNVLLELFRPSGDTFQMRIAEDLYRLATADCLIRSTSHFSGVAQLIGNHKMVIWPNAIKWIDNPKRLLVTSTAVAIRLEESGPSQIFLLEQMSSQESLLLKTLFDNN